MDAYVTGATIRKLREAKSLRRRSWLINWM